MASYKNIVDFRLCIPVRAIVEHLMYGRRVWGGGVGVGQRGVFSRGKNVGKPRYVVNSADECGANSERIYSDPLAATWEFLRRTDGFAHLTVTE